MFAKLHRRIAPILFLPLLATALTGVAYRLGRTWFGVSDTVADWFMTIHQGEFLGRPLVPVYVLLVGLGLLGLIATGMTMFRRRRLSLEMGFPKSTSDSQPRKAANGRILHYVMSLVFFVPLAVSAMTGMGYRLGRNWFGLSNQQAAMLLRIHQGTYLGSVGRVFYVLLLGAGLVALLITGINMTGILRKRRQPATIDEA